MGDLNGTHKTIIVVVFLAAVVTLAWSGNDTAALIAVGTAMLGALGMSVATTNAVKEQTNGNMAKLLEMQQKQAEMLAQMLPPKEPPNALDVGETS